MTAIPLTLGRVTFPSKASAQEAVRQILYSTSLNTPLRPFHDEIVHALFRLHARYEEKTQNQYDHTIVKKHGDHGQANRGFYMVLKDKTHVEIGFNKVFQNLGKPIDPKRYFREAARYATQNHTATYKLSRFNYNRDSYCPDDMTGLPLSFKEAHVDHAPPNIFAAILKSYLAAHPLPPTQEIANHRELYPEEAARFLAFHNARAQLRIIDAKSNIGRKYDRLVAALAKPYLLPPKTPA